MPSARQRRRRKEASADAKGADAEAQAAAHDEEGEHQAAEGEAHELISIQEAYDQAAHLIAELTAQEMGLGDIRVTEENAVAAHLPVIIKQLAATFAEVRGSSTPHPHAAIELQSTITSVLAPKATSHAPQELSNMLITAEDTQAAPVAARGARPSRHTPQKGVEPTDSSTHSAESTHYIGTHAHAVEPGINDTPHAELVGYKGTLEQAVGDSYAPQPKYYDIWEQSNRLAAQQLSHATDQPDYDNQLIKTTKAIYAAKKKRIEFKRNKANRV